MSLTDADLARRIEASLDRLVRRLVPLGGGCIAMLRRVELDNGERIVAKASSSGGMLLEGFMLDYLRRKTELPVPDVLGVDDDLLLLSHIDTDGRLTAAGEIQAAEMLAALHNITAPEFGFECDTVIGSLPQPNPWRTSWRSFFAEQRLVHFGRMALESGNLSPACFARLEAFALRLERFFDEPPAASLIHGDVWGGNVLVRGGKIAGFIDPAIYFADPEIELAFSTLFSTFGDPFFRRYQEIRPLQPGFFEARRDILNLYPLLVHTVLFGGHYGVAVEETLRRYS